MNRRSLRPILALAIVVSACLIGCGFFDPDNPPDPIWGVWTGAYPTVLSSEPDSARWVFSSGGVYLFYALKKDGDLLGRETGFYSNEGILLVLSSDRAGENDVEEITFHAVDDLLTLEIRGETSLYKRLADADEADRLGEALRW